LKLLGGAIKFPTVEMQHHTQALSHIDLVLSQLTKNVLHNLQSILTQKIHLCMESTMMELAKVNEENATLQAKYSILVKEWDEVV
jgi:hypothetical protein